MRGLNKATLIGNLGADPEIKYTQSGTPVCNVNLATNETWTDRNGDKQERVEWHRLVMWAKLAEIAGEYLRKGNAIYVEGQLQTRKWEDKQNVTHYTTEINVRQMIMLGDSSGSGGGSGPMPEEGMGSQTASSGMDDLGGEDDLPF